MTCNTAIDYGCHNDQDEWTPYIAFSLHNAKDRLLSYPIKAMKCKLPNKILSKNGSCLSVTPPNKTWSAPKSHLLLEKHNTGNLSHNNSTNNEELEKSTLNTISSFSSEQTAQLWQKLKKSCKTKTRACWQDSLENNFFLQTLGVSNKRTRYEDENQEVSMWNLQRCTCKDFKETSRDDETLDELMECDEGCISPCLCPKYFISKSGLVFGSFEEKQDFDEKMEHMDEVFKSELRMIKEQHERLREDLTPQLQDSGS